ncbi:pirin family protein [Labilibaculum sp. A4]|uniref:pirin family protein n=1 Tax=Labilibaculum euxinus TaxID=2686357 RepID=UPI000F6217AF|nr:pirin family protein [Labilibaculum euxinus]MDQ1771261.1 pirin family protein [Labilibaculum euxinus]MWN77048.1 pirin family protein [Labilibaculum euxinus]
MDKVFHEAGTRGSSQLDWLDSKHSFSFADYYCPERIHFGALRVLNDDVVKAGMGFGTHSHQNMEIISIPLKGALKHKDSAGHSELIKVNDVQVMTAGKGIMHSEYNASETEDVHFLQVWIIPEKEGLEPSYDQRSFPDVNENGELQLLVAPKSSQHNALKINQNAYVFRAKVTSGNTLEYTINGNANGVYVFVLNGELTVDGEVLRPRDGIGVDSVNSLDIMGIVNSDFLIFEVPMH